MHYELIAILCIIICLFVLGAEYLWLYILAEKQEKIKTKYELASERVANLVEGIFYSPTTESRKQEIEALKKLCGDDTRILEMICGQLCFWSEYGDEETLGGTDAVVDEIYKALEPTQLFARLLQKKDNYSKGYACRRLADFDAYEYLEEIQKLAESRNCTLSYNAAMALARLGDARNVAAYLLRIQNDKRYSARIVFELFDCFSLKREELAHMIFEKCSDYMKITTIKAISKYRLEVFEDMYIEGTKSEDVNMRIACVKALGDLAKPKNEHILIVASKDREWVVRSYAVKGLSLLRSPAAIAAVKEAAGDQEWWVRQAAADALLRMNVRIRELEDILGGYDKYAADAVKYSLYRNVDVRGNAK